jgi:predicted SprT family Zn-dependent metalloprotease
MTTTTAPIPAETLRVMAEGHIARELKLRWTVKINPLMRTTLGLCHYDRRVIELNPNVDSVTEAELTVLHELAHAKVHEAELFQSGHRKVFTVGRKAGKRADHHGAAWKAAYAELLAKHGYAGVVADGIRAHS